LEEDRRSREVYRRGSIGSNKEIRGRLETREKSNSMKGENLHPRLSYIPRRNYHQIPQL